MKNFIWLLTFTVLAVLTTTQMDTKDLVAHENARLESLRHKWEQMKQGKAEPAPIKLAAAQSVEKENLPDEILDLKKRKVQVFSEMNRLHAQLLLLPSDDARREAAIRIVSLDRELKTIWKDIDAYEQDGVIPQPEPDEFAELNSLSPVQLIRERNNARTLVSKYKDKPEKAEIVAQKLAYINQIEKIIG